MRIISTVPSQTELLADLGLEKEVVGITKFCVHPESWFRSKTRIGGTKNLNIEKIISLKPDLVIANKEENVKEQIEALAEVAEIHVSEVKTIEDNLELIMTIGTLTGKRMTALRLRQELSEVMDALSYNTTRSAAYLIWRDPWMTVGNETFIHNLMQKCGLQNIFSLESRYPETTLLELRHLNPEVVLLSSEPFPFKQKHLEELQTHLPDSKICLVDGEAFSWYGTRLLRKSNYLNSFMAQL